MNKNDIIFQRQSETIRFKNGDMDFMLNWAIGIGQIIGLSTAQVFHAVSGLKDGDAHGWRSGFYRQAQAQLSCARQGAGNGNSVAAGQAYLGAAYAIRAALQYTSPVSPDFALRISEMESAFAQGIHALNVPLRPIDVPFEDFTLCGYFLEHDAQSRPTIVMIGGGDTFREDLFYFAGYPGWMRGYNVIMVDLPGQGKLPGYGAHFRPDMDAPIRAILDWLELNAAVMPQQIALYGVSGGGYFTALAAHDPRISAWIAATPIYDVGEVFRHEAGGALKTPGWMLNAAMRVIGSLNESAQINLDKYAWQYGVADFKAAVEGTMARAKIVDYQAITCPSLFLVSDGEGAELKRQTQVLYEDFIKRGVPVTRRCFTVDEGADAHCELNNLRLAHHIIFDWLDVQFQHDSGDIRLRC